MSATVDPHAPVVRATCDICGLLRICDAEGKSPVYNFGPFNAHRECYEGWLCAKPQKGAR